MNKKILISTSSFDRGHALIDQLKNKFNYDIIFNPHGRRLIQSEIMTLLTENVVGLIAGLEPLTRTVLSQARNLRVISRCGMGMDNVDVDAAAQLGITVYNTPDAPTQAVAELTVGLMLSLLRHIAEADRTLRANQWQPKTGRLLANKTIGIIGFGRIGKRVQEVLRGFGCQFMIYDLISGEQQGIKIAAHLEDVLSVVDVVTMHLPYSEKTHHLIGEKELSCMKKSALLINTARGGLVDEEALYQALVKGKLAGAGLDVFEQEPYQGKLNTLSQVILTAHMGSYAEESRLQMEQEALQNLLLGLQ